MTTCVPWLWLATLALLSESLAAPAAPGKPSGLETRPIAKAYLQMPTLAGGAMPPLLSQTGAFKNTRDLVPSESLIPYELNFPFWSDGAEKQRWIAVPNDSSAGVTKIGFAATGEWTFPHGTVLVKHFEIATNETRPDLSRRRLETRLIVCDTTGSVYGVTYKWRADNSDAELLTNSVKENLLITTVTGVRTQVWYYPSRQDCRTCHTDRAGGVLGVKTRQLNRDFAFANGNDNEIRAWNHLGLFSPAANDAELASYPRLARPDDARRSLEDRARSYLDANCAHCHRPGGTVAFFDTRYDTPLARQGLIQGDVLFDQGLDRARVIAPNDPWRSVGLLRVESLEGDKMPPLAHSVLDRQGVDLLRAWIESLPGRTVLAPPSLSPPGGKYAGPIEVTLRHETPGVSIRYTVDGSEPTSSDPLYTAPIKLSGPTTVRAKAFKPGLTRSITVQQTYVEK